METSFSFAVAEPSQVGEARRHIQNLVATKLDFDPTEAGKVAIVVNELGTNLVKHARGGELLVRLIGSGATKGLEVLALDRGPGMANLAECLRDGYSTAGSPGTGLGAIQRASRAFEIHSVPGLGTAVLCRFWAKPPQPERAGALEVGAVSTPIRGETVCGDSWTVASDAALVADGLGHGPIAAEAAAEAVRIFDAHHALAPREVLQRAHDALRKTRGAAVAVARIDPARNQLQYAGLGNVSGVIVSPEGRSQSLVSQNGTAGAESRSLREYTYPWNPGSLLVMHSDGLTARWQLDRYPGLAARHPSLIAGVLYRDFRRGTDDSTVIVLKGGRPA